MVAIVIVDWDTIANGLNKHLKIVINIHQLYLNGPLSRSPALLIFLALRLALDRYGATLKQNTSNLVESK